MSLNYLSGQQWWLGTSLGGLYSDGEGGKKLALGCIYSSGCMIVAMYEIYVCTGPARSQMLNIGLCVVVC